MNDQVKLMSAVVAGYLLGRTKQGKRAIRLAVWLSGGKAGVATTLAQQARVNLEGNAAVAALLEQVKGPLVDAGRKALTSALEQRATALADSLHDRTEALALPGGETATDTVKSTASSAKKAGSKLTGRSAGDDEAHDDEAHHDDEAGEDSQADESDRGSADEAAEDERPEPARNDRRSSAGSKSGRTTKTASRTGKSAAASGGTGRAKRTADSGTTKRSGSTRSSGRSTAQSRQSGGDTRSRSGSTRRRSGQ